MPKIFAFKKYFNWRIITLGVCGIFCLTSTWISHGCICVPYPELPSPLLSPPRLSGLSHSTSFECPASCIKLALVIYFTYGNIHVSVLENQIHDGQTLDHSKFIKINTKLWSPSASVSILWWEVRTTKLISMVLIYNPLSGPEYFPTILQNKLTLIPQYREMAFYQMSCWI